MLPVSRTIRFNAFDMNCVAHQSPGLWRHPEDRSAQYKDLDYWTDLAKILERGRFDGLFIADVLGTYDVYGASDEAAIRQAAQIPVNDPLLLVSAMALVTEHLGFGITTGTGFEHPYPFARRVSTLDHLTKGRIGWNVVTGYLPSAARNMGQTDQLAHDARYDHADEYLEVLYKLWEGSWEDDAVVRDKERGVFTDPDKVHHIGHEGTHFSVPGIHLSEPSPQRTPVIYQAGASPRGVRFAAENAEAIFIAAPTKAILRDTVDHDPARARAGRPRPVRGEDLHAVHHHHRRHRRGGPRQARRVPVLRRPRGRTGVHVRLDGRRPVAVRARRADRQRRLQRHPVGGRGVPVRRSRRPRVDRRRHRRRGARSAASVR